MLGINMENCKCDPSSSLAIYNTWKPLKHYWRYHYIVSVDSFDLSRMFADITPHNLVYIY